MDQLSPAERAEVEGSLVSNPVLKNDLNEIERSLEIFAATAAILSPAGVKERILDAIRNEGGNGNAKGGSGSIWPFLSIIFGLLTLVLGYLFYQKGNEAKNLQDEIIAVRDTCQTRTNELNNQLNLLLQLTQPTNKILPFTATPSFASTDLYLHINKATKRNFIQVRNLPALTANQAYELWSIKTGSAPVPLNVFEAPPNGLIEVSYVDGTEVYAITIEAKGGVNSPTMANLIGTVSVAGI